MKRMLVMMVLMASWAQASKIAVLDQQAALFSTKVAEAENVRLQADFGDMDAERQRLMQELNQLARQYQNDAAILSEQEKNEQQAKIERARQRYAELNSQLAQSQQQREQAFIAEYRQPLVQAIEAVVKKGEYDIVLDANAVIFVKDGIDITEQVITEFDRLTAQ